jgi:'Cold-shock' DNA-binding domain
MRVEIVMATGTVKWFNPTKGYGFIQPRGRRPFGTIWIGFEFIRRLKGLMIMFDDGNIQC